MKKFLSLVLALVMTMSLVTVSAGAEDFTDDSSIKYDEAVDVMSAVKVIDGYTDGSFQPTTNLTRGAAAKIICNLILGPTTAAALGADTAPYSDVPTTNVFAGYIAYCQKEGIISGYADGTFRPSAPLTGYAFMKMLLGALGYDSAKEGYTGANWSVNVAKQAIAIGLNKGNDDFVGQATVNREEAMLYAFNMIQADLVEYPNDSTIVVGDVTVSTAGKAQSVTWGTSADKDGNIKADGYVQFAERFFNKLDKNASTSDAFMQPATKWTVSGQKIGTYVDAPAATYTTNVTTGTIYADLGMNQSDVKSEVYVNGVAVTPVQVSKNNERKIASTVANNGLVADGSTVNVYYDADNNDVTICVIDNYVGHIANVDTKAATPFVNVSSDSTVKKVDGTSLGAAYKAKFETSKTFSEDDVVVFTYSQKAGEDGIQSVATIESVEGTVAQYILGKSLTMGDTTYKYSKNIAFSFGSESSMNTKNDYVVYLDENGYAIYVEEKEFNSSEYAYVLAVEAAAQTGFTSNRAKLLTAEGKLMTVTTDDNYTDLANTIVNYRADSNNNYVLRQAANTQTNCTITTAASGDVNTKGPIVGGVADFSMSNTNATVTMTTGMTRYANSETIFVVMDLDGSKVTYSVYTGIKNAPTINSGTVEAAWTMRGNVMGIVFIDASEGATVTNASKDVLFLASKESVSKLVTDGDNNQYYLYNAVQNGEIVTVKVSAAATGLVPGAEVSTNEVYTNVQTNNKGIITSVSGLGGTPYAGGTINATGIWKLSGDYTIGLNASKDRYTVASDAKIYRIDTDGVITKLNSVSEIYSDASAQVKVLLNGTDGDLDYIFIQEVSSNPNAGAGLGTSYVTSFGSWTTPNLTLNLGGDVKAGDTFKVTVSQLRDTGYVEIGEYTSAAVASNGDSTVNVTLNLPSGNLYRVTCTGVAGYATINT